MDSDKSMLWIVAIVAVVGIVAMIAGMQRTTSIDTYLPIAPTPEIQVEENSGGEATANAAPLPPAVGAVFVKSTGSALRSTSGSSTPLLPTLAGNSQTQLIAPATSPPITRFGMLTNSSNNTSTSYPQPYWVSIQTQLAYYDTSNGARWLTDYGLFKAPSTLMAKAALGTDYISVNEISPYYIRVTTPYYIMMVRGSDSLQYAWGTNAVSTKYAPGSLPLSTNAQLDFQSVKSWVAQYYPGSTVELCTDKSAKKLGAFAIDWDTQQSALTPIFSSFEEMFPSGFTGGSICTTTPTFQKTGYWITYP